ncbi:hypothetical protein RHMOL_Rhmol06G0302300 [Rhododendron molle]|uniref:Uncharacterized protein n=1 Tax=Rhododendron molle TaxID=49168 RepID=A0ACC0NK56_RHOML|nr:hypothetical protein RHMOL_Rhmol06G0302300 [Rhododendron molle]
MFLNEDEVLTMMRALGFTVVVAKPGMMRHLNTVSWYDAPSKHGFRDVEPVQCTGWGSWCWAYKCSLLAGRGCHGASGGAEPRMVLRQLLWRAC